MSRQFRATQVNDLQTLRPSVNALHKTIAAVVILLAVGTSIPAQAKVVKETTKLNGKAVSVPAFSWADDDVRPSAVLITVHGGVQHAGSYRAMAEQLAPRGILIYSIDLRGHGEWKSSTAKVLPKLNYKASSDDLIVVAQQIRARHPDLPLFCMGESLGAAVALDASVTSPKLFDGLILSSPGTHPDIRYAWPAIFGSVYDGATTLCSSINLAPHLQRISEDKRSCEEMINDASNRNKASLGELLHMAGFVRANYARAAKLDETVPVLVLQGTDDRICSAASARKVFEQMHGRNKSLKIFKGCGHLLTTTEFLKPEVVSVVADWLRANCAPPSSAESSRAPKD